MNICALQLKINSHLPGSGTRDLWALGKLFKWGPSSINYEKNIKNLLIFFCLLFKIIFILLRVLLWSNFTIAYIPRRAISDPKDQRQCTFSKVSILAKGLQVTLSHSHSQNMVNKIIAIKYHFKWAFLAFYMQNH